MRAVQITQAGGPEVLHVVDAPTPEPAPGQVLIRVSAAGVNFSDTLQRSGKYPIPGGGLPVVPGNEVVGVVAAHGGGVDAPPVGSRVAAILWGGGGYAAEVAVPADGLVPVPDGVSDVQALAAMIQGLSAELMLRWSAPLTGGERVVVHTAAGGVGSWLVQLAKAAGAGTVLATAGDDAKLAVARRLGADAVVDYRSADWGQRLLTETGGVGPDVILDGVGGDVTRTGLTLLAPFGRFVTYGAASGHGVTLDAQQVLALVLANQRLVGFTLYALANRPREVVDAASQLLKRVDDGELTVLEGHLFPLESAGEAHHALETRQTTGKVALQL